MHYADLLYAKGCTRLDFSLVGFSKDLQTILVNNKCDQTAKLLVYSRRSAQAKMEQDPYIIKRKLIESKNLPGCAQAEILPNHGFLKTLCKTILLFNLSVNYRS